MTRALLSLIALLLTALPAASEPQNYIYAGSGDDPRLWELLARDDIDGVQIIYNWRMLEPQEGEYDFSIIERDLARAEALGKPLFVQLQDRFFLTRYRNIPQYLQDDPIYGGGLVPQIDNPGEGKAQQQGWVAAQWNGPLRARFQALIAALAAEFDGRIAGINLPESSADVDQDTPGFTCDAYFAATIENVTFARQAFQQSHVVQYVNFWPCEWNDDQGYMSATFETAVAQGFGLGGPDIVPYRRGQMKNSYPFFNARQDELSLIAMAIQEPTLTYTNPQTGETFTRAEFVNFAENYLGVDIIFWTMEAPWLAE